jgi:dipeptide transport system substrate-binding protein
VEKVDDNTVSSPTRAGSAVLSNLAMEYAGVQSKEYADAMLKAGTPEKVDQSRSAPDFMLVQYRRTPSSDTRRSRLLRG